MATATAVLSKTFSRNLLAWDNDLYSVRGIAIKAAYFFLHLIDLSLTVFAVNLGHSELNPIMVGLLSKPLQLVLFKFFIPLIIARYVPSKFLIPGVMLISLVVCWNIKELLLVLF